MSCKKSNGAPARPCKDSLGNDEDAPGTFCADGPITCARAIVVFGILGSRINLAGTDPLASQSVATHSSVLVFAHLTHSGFHVRPW